MPSGVNGISGGGCRGAALLARDEASAGQAAARKTWLRQKPTKCFLMTANSVTGEQYQHLAWLRRITLYLGCINNSVSGASAVTYAGGAFDAKALWKG
jgi:hypothetical protein